MTTPPSPEPTATASVSSGAGTASVGRVPAEQVYRDQDAPGGTENPFGTDCHTPDCEASSGTDDCTVARVEDDQVKGRYVAYNAAGVEMGWLGYRIDKGVLVIWTTRTEPQFRGHGVADVMTRHAMDAAIAAGTPVQPDCWYASEWIQKHPKYARHVIDPGF